MRSNGVISYHNNQKKPVLTESGNELLKAQLKRQLGGHPLQNGVIYTDTVYILNQRCLYGTVSLSSRNTWF